jgi:hypothetical protein
MAFGKIIAVGAFQTTFFCVVLRILPQSEMITSTRPTLRHRWIPFKNSPSLPSQPAISVQLSHEGHVLRVKPVLCRAAMPQAEFPGIVHVSPTIISQSVASITRVNISDILTCHRKTLELSTVNSRALKFSLSNSIART